MTLRRRLLGFVAIVAAISAFVVGTSDVHYRERNCGSALVAADPNKFALEAEDAPTRDFIENDLAVNCAQRITARRFLSLVPVGVSVAAVVVGRRLRDLEDSRS